MKNRHHSAGRAGGRFLPLAVAILTYAGIAHGTDDASVTAIRQQAEAAKAQLLAPSAYEEGVKHHERARREGRSRAPEQLARAHAAFESALAGARRALDDLGPALEARDAAQAAEAWRLAIDEWQAAERNLDQAARGLERSGDAVDAAAVAASFDAAARAARHNQWLAPVREALAAAESDGARRRAPRAMAEATASLARAEEALDAAGAEPERAGEAIGVALRAAVRAGRVARLASRIGRDYTAEDLILDFETRLETLALAAGVEAGNTPDEAQAGLEQALAALRRQARDAMAEAQQRNRQVASLEEEVRELNDRLDGTSSQRDRLMMAMEQQDRERERLRTVEQLVQPSGGRVLREADSIVLRLTGIEFASGSARIPSASAALLERVGRALELFPRSRITIEGHTDSSGSEAANRRLSEERARSVEGWLRDRLGYPEGRLAVIGHGAAHPVARNDSAEGRAANRRIDVIIRAYSADRR